eukprot:TRINITY_DN7014_c0_g1_i10.p1 TRINITY_DN7014_c0_g1~~TRINITY_DN7014_c0_g1_i10.p1  ORF type:complete len:160 (+),score=32.00 TRINITY_DN7014_c0_g1_i10:65-544(+)
MCIRDRTERVAKATLAEELATEFSVDALDKYLEVLSKHSLKPLIRSQEDNYSVNVGHLIYALKVKQVERMLETKLGANHARVFRFLMRSQPSGELQVGERCMMTLQSVRGTLYELYRERYIAVQELKEDKSGQQSSVYFVKFRRFSKESQLCYTKCSLT